MLDMSYRQCTYCGKKINKLASKCPFCQDASGDNPVSENRMKEPITLSSRVLLVTAILLGIFAFVSLYGMFNVVDFGGNMNAILFLYAIFFSSNSLFCCFLSRTFNNPRGSLAYCFLWLYYPVIIFISLPGVFLASMAALEK